MQLHPLCADHGRILEVEYYTFDRKWALPCLLQILKIPINYQWCKYLVALELLDIS